MTTDLDWLARNVHEWPSDEVERIGLDPDGEVRFAEMGGETITKYDFYPADPANGLSNKYLNERHYTRDQWQSRRAELQNKPSWDDAPDWATHMLTTSRDWGGSADFIGAVEFAKRDGIYYFDVDGAQFLVDDCAWVVVAAMKSDGSWCNMIGNRPDIDDEVGQLINNAFASKSVKPLTRRASKWNGEGLPPVGAYCWCFSDGYVDWCGCKIIAVHGDEFWAHIDSNKSSNIYKISDYIFRPLRTEEDNSVEEIMNVIASVSHPDESVECAIDIIAKQLYRAGYRKLDTEGGNG